MYKATPEAKEKKKKYRSTPSAREADRKCKATPVELEKARKRKATPVELEKARKRKLTPSAKLKSCERSFKIRNERNNLSRILVFKTAVKEGPYHLCVVCNRCLYRKTVKLFDCTKYDTQFTYLFTTVKSFDTNYYICLTCDQYIKKKKVPCQSVWNKLVLDDIPEELSMLNRLENILISKRILFKKISIMPKGQQPKIRGAVCNIPIQTRCLPG